MNEVLKPTQQAPDFEAEGLYVGEKGQFNSLAFRSYTFHY